MAGLKDRGLHLLTGDAFLDFPVPAQESDDPEWRAFADIINAERDGVKKDGFADGSLAIDHLDDLFKCEKIPDRLVTWVADMLAARYSPGDSPLTIKRAICDAMAQNRLHATVVQIKDYIEECTGTRPDILPTSAYDSGWDENNLIDDPPTQANFQDGHMWDEDGTYEYIAPGPFFWSTIPTGLLIDIKNDGAYTADELQCVYEVVAKYKNAELAAEVGYFDTGTGTKVILKTVWSTDLTQTGPGVEIDPGI